VVRRLTLVAIGSSLLAAGCFTDPSGVHPCAACQECESCVEGPDGPSCQAASHASELCVGDEIHWIDSCGADEGVGESCPAHSSCADDGAGSATCVCTNHWQGDGCDVCPDNWDPSADCAECETHWIDEGNDCGTCPGNWDATANCAECLNHWIDEDNDCGTCPPNWDPAQDCDACLGNWDVGTGCEECLGNWDAATGCTTCANQWIDDGDDCGTCPGNWDPETDCSTCLPHWSGSDCSVCRVFVDTDSSTSFPDGLTWATAFSDVAAAASAAAEGVAAVADANCEIWVAEGSYFVFHTTDADTVEIGNGVRLYGGFAGTESTLAARDWSAHVTTLSGHESFAGAQHVRHVLSTSGEVVIDGFTISDGDATSVGAVGEHDQRGGGVLAVSGTPRLENCSIESNHAGDQGGGIYSDGASPTLTNCAFSDNTAGFGAGVYALNGDTAVNGCTFDGNEAGFYGSAIVDDTGAIEIDQSQFTSNVSSDEGAVVLWLCTSAMIERSLFQGNTVISTSMGGAGIGNLSLSATIDRCAFIGNSAGHGSAIVASDGTTTIIENSLFYMNTASSVGGAITAWTDASVLLHHCTAARNEASTGSFLYFIAADGGNVTVTNSILWDDTSASGSELYFGTGATVAVSYSVVHDGFAGGDHIVDTDPLFADIENGDLHLLSSSPAIDAADGTIAPATDYDGNPRVDDPSTPNTGIGPPWADMGAFEFQP
jgi:predicted outer membrane repeat protein